MKNITKIMLLFVVILTGCKKEPQASFVIEGEPFIAPCTVNLTNTSMDAEEFVWSFGSLFNSSEESPSYTFEDPGTYRISLEAKNGNKSDTYSENIIILPPYETVKINSVRIDQLPLANSNGTGWDAFDGADLYFTISDVNTNIFFTSSTLNDLTPNMLPLIAEINNGFAINDLDFNYFIDLWDADSPDSDDVIGWVRFTFNEYTTGSNRYPTSVTKVQNGISVTLSLQWY